MSGAFYQKQDAEERYLVGPEHVVKNLLHARLHVFRRDGKAKNTLVITDVSFIKHHANF